MTIPIEQRISLYMAKLDPSVSGQNGHSSLFHAAAVLALGWALADEQALPFLIEFNQRCMPPWPHSELRRKLKESRKKQDRYRHPIGYLRGDEKLPEVAPTPDPIEPEEKPDLTRFRKGYNNEFQKTHQARGWSIEALRLAQAAGILRFGKCCGLDCWIARDNSGICAEARRLDGLFFPPFMTEDKEFKERKAHAIKHSKKWWPVGIRPSVWPADPFYSITMHEGGPDLLTAFHFSFLQKRNDVLHVAMLGKNPGIHGFHPDSHELLRGRRVRIYPHTDSHDLALHWADQLLKLDCKLDFFVFDGLSKANGAPAKDLCDCLELDPKFSSALEELFP